MFFFFFFDDKEDDKDFRESFSKLLHNYEKLPIRWDGKDFYKDLEKRLQKYKESLERISNINLEKIDEINQLILSAVEYYLNGMPSNAYNQISELITNYYNNLSVEDKDITGYRIVSIDDNKLYDRKRVFHVPFSLREKIKTDRYSIPGYPCLYLADCFDGCLNEVGYNPANNYIISKFKSDKKLKILDLSVSPNEINVSLTSNSPGEQLEYSCLNYMYSFPLMIACSYIRNKPDLPFALEYIIPQLLLQCFHKGKLKTDGIRYLSCKTNINKKFRNYVFLTEYNSEIQSDYCKKLSNVFSLTSPYYIKDCPDLSKLKVDIDSDSDYLHIEI